jgi:hypothetical protein
MLVPVLTAAIAVHPCRAALPRGPAVPAPIVLWTSCGAFRLSKGGRVTRLPRHWLARHGSGTGRRYGADLQLRPTRDGRMVVRRRGALVWRSTGLHRSDGGVAFGPHEFAWASYGHGIYLTDLVSPERLVVRGRSVYPIDFTRRGDLLVAERRAIAVVSRQGRILHRYRFRVRNGFAFDASTDTLFFVTPGGTLAAARGERLTLVRRLPALAGTVTTWDGGPLVFAGGHEIAVVNRDGNVVARTRWREGTLDSGVSVSADGRSYAFRLTHRGRATVLVLRAGSDHAQVVFRHRPGPTGCAAGANLTWRGRFLIYDSSDGELAVLDPAGTAIDLRAFAAQLPRLSPEERAAAAWRTDFRR